MGKRSNFERIENDRYDTPARATWPLLAHVPAGTAFAEPCAGKGDLIRHLAEDEIICRYASDIAPRNRRSPMKIERRPFHRVTAEMIAHCDMVITNPPWDREILHPFIDHFLELGKPMWLLFDADWMHNNIDVPRLLKRCVQIVSIGRVKWIADSDGAGKENCCWYLFRPGHHSGPHFTGRRG
jgi:hypothetical protein